MPKVFQEGRDITSVGSMRRFLTVILVISLGLTIACQIPPAPDGWSKYAGNPILEPEGTEVYTTWASALKVDNTYHMYYSYRHARDKLKIGHAKSNDGKAWTKDRENNPALVGTPEEWDADQVWCPFVWKEADTWYMLYAGSSSSVKAIGLATSSDGTSWTKEGTNPVLEGTVGEWDENDAENWGVIKIGSTYYLFYDTVKGERKVGIATSTNLTSWSKDANNPILTGGRFCSDVFKYRGHYYLLVSHYTFWTNYAVFELYRDSNPTFYSADRTYLGAVLGHAADTTAWDYHDCDTPFVLTTDITRSAFVNGELWVYYGGEKDGLWREGLAIETNPGTALASDHQR